MAAGGTLYQDIGSLCPQAIKHDYFSANGDYQRDLLVHEVSVQPDSSLSEILGPDRVLVNSMHHQAIKTLAPGLVATAFAPDGIIEGVEAIEGSFLVAVQWHPEELTENVPLMRRLFKAFVEASASQDCGR